MSARFCEVAGAAATPLISITVDGLQRTVPSGASVAAALLHAGQLTLRTHPVTGQRRAPYCLMGVCSECLVTIEGRQQRACMTLVRPGMEVGTL